MFGSGQGLPAILLAILTIALTVAAVRAAAQGGRPLLEVLWPTRAALLTLLAGLLLLFAAGQGRELIDGLDAAPWAHLAWFAVALLYWSFQCWHWSRVELYLAFGTDRQAWGGRARLILHLPRVYGVAVHLMALMAIVWSASATRPGLAVLAPIGAVLLSVTIFLLLVSRRLALLDALEHKGLAAGPLARALTTRPIRPGAPLRQALGALAPLSRLVLAGSLALFALNAALGGLWPVETGARHGSAAIAFGGLGSWVAILSILALASRAFRFPVLASLVLARIVTGLLVDEHPVRGDPTSVWDGPEADPRPTLVAEFGRWRGGVVPGGEAPVPLVLVATAGGGLRAAWWTATALAGLMERHPGLERHIVAVSGVSGGSLGAAVVAACLAREQERARAGPLDAGRIGACARGVLANDFLAPTLVALLYTDVLGPALTEPLGLGGRAAALENAWAAAFDQLPERPIRPDGSWRNPLAEPFLGLGSGGEGWLPILLLNATHEERGRRVVASRVRVDQPPFLDAWDLHRLMGRDLWTVSAVHNSARFTFVSPAGLVRGPAPESAARGHLLDGGYFENFGAATLLEALRGIQDGLDEPARFLPIVIQITSDPELAGHDIVTDGACREPEPLPFAPGDARSPFTLANEALAPLAGLLATREARGLLAVRELARAVRCAPRPAAAPEPAFVHLAMCGMGERRPALGWVLDSRSREAIDGLLDPRGCNGPELAELDRALRAAQLALAARDQR
jgi:hypothetical protein